MPPQVDYVLDAVRRSGLWTLFFTVLAVLVVYDQSKDTPLVSLLSIVALTNTDFSTVSYIWSKGSIVGPSWKTPFIGPFLQSVNPKFEEYVDKWRSGPLSCVSVFHKYVAECPPYMCDMCTLPSHWAPSRVSRLGGACN